MEQPGNVQFRYARHSLRSRKNRLFTIVSKEMRTIGIAIALLLILCGAGLWMFGPDIVGAIVMAAGWALITPLLWLYYDISRLRPHLDAMNSAGTVALEESLPVDVASRLKNIESPYALWEAVKGTWYHSVFSARYRMPSDLFEQLPKDPDPALVARILTSAHGMSAQSGLSQLSPVALLIALLQPHPQYQTLIAQLKLDESDLLEGVRWIHHHRDAIDQVDRRGKSGGLARDWTSGFTPTLNRMSVNISDFIESGGLAHQHVGSHEATINEIIQDLQKPRANVMLIGDVGSGKTMSIKGFAKRILQDSTLPESVRYHRVYQVSASAIVSASADQNAVESTLYSIVAEASKAKNAILFFDNAVNFFSSGNGAIDLSRAMLDIAKTASVQTIFEMTPVEWQEVSAQHNELAAILNVLHVPQTEQQQTMDILEDHSLVYESRSGVVFTYKALQECITMADRYVQGLVFPGKAISVLESAVGHAEGTLVTAASVQQAIEATYGIKVQVADAVEGQQLLQLEDQIHERMVNQYRAVRVVSDALRRARSGVSNPNKPIGTFLFLGPTGVGKTELSKALAAVYFGDEAKMVRVDMNEYTQSADLGRLLDVSSPASLLSAVGRERFTVVLFDEIEKAHPEVVNAFLQLLDEGEMRDAANRTVSFRDAIVIATSNAGADKIRAYIDQGLEVQQFEQQFISQLIDSAAFKPEFLNRFDETVVFRPLKIDELLQVMDLLIASVNRNLEKQKISVQLTQPAKEWLVTQGNDPRLGARPLRRMVQRTVENTVAKRLLAGQVPPGTIIQLDLADLQAEL